MPFNDSIGEVSQDLGKQEKKQFWWNQAQNLIYPLLALGILFVFWRLLKGTPVEHVPVGLSVEEWDAERGNGNGQPPLGRPRHAASGVVTAEVFSQLVRENPENMTQAIQTWLARGKPSQN
jgi:hypothetical protein